MPGKHWKRSNSLGPISPAICVNCYFLTDDTLFSEFKQAVWRPLNLPTTINALAMRGHIQTCACLRVTVRHACCSSVHQERPRKPLRHTVDPLTSRPSARDRPAQRPPTEPREAHNLTINSRRHPLAPSRRVPDGPSRRRVRGSLAQRTAASPSTRRRCRPRRDSCAEG